MGYRVMGRLSETPKGSGPSWQPYSGGQLCARRWSALCIPFFAVDPFKDHHSKMGKPSTAVRLAVGLIAAEQRGLPPVADHDLAAQEFLGTLFTNAA